MSWGSILVVAKQSGKTESLFILTVIETLLIIIENSSLNSLWYLLTGNFKKSLSDKAFSQYWDRLANWYDCSDEWKICTWIQPYQIYLRFWGISTRHVQRGQMRQRGKCKCKSNLCNLQLYALHISFSAYSSAAREDDEFDTTPNLKDLKWKPP